MTELETFILKLPALAWQEAFVLRFAGGHERVPMEFPQPHPWRLANNVWKAVTVQAPLFIKTGEKIKIDTRTGKYMERA